MFFLPCGWIGLLIFLRNEKKQCANLWVDSKKCDRKKQQQGGCAEATKKTVQAMRYEWWGFFVTGDCPAELPVINFQALPDRLILFVF